MSAEGSLSSPRRQPRITPLLEEEWSPEVRELLHMAGENEMTPATLNLFRTVARHPGLMRRWVPFGGKLLHKGKLAERSRELLILRTAWLCQAAYEWGQHVHLAHSIGITPEEIDAVTIGPRDSIWSDDDATLLQAVDELHISSTIHEATWARLVEVLEPVHLIELCLLVGQYHSVAYLGNALEIPLDEGMGDLGVR